MNRSQLRALARLPVTAAAWEVALIDLSAVADEMKVEGILVVAERGSGLPRCAAPIPAGKSLWGALGPAFLQPPPPCVPARPPRLLCADPSLAARLRAELKELAVPVEQVPEVAAAEELVAAMMRGLAPPPVPGITVETALWASTLETLCRIAPWRALSDAVRFRFAGDVPELADAVALVLGDTGEHVGISLYPTAEDHARFLEATETGDLDTLLGEVESLNLHLERLVELEPEEQAACRAAGLVTSDGRCPHLFVFAEGGGHPASEREQRVMLAALEAIVALCAGGAADLDHRPAARTVSTSLGRIEVRAVPAALEDEPLLVEADHVVAIGRLRTALAEQPTLVVKLRKGDAEALRSRLLGVDALRVEPAADGGHLVRVSAGARELGALVRVSADEAATLGAEPRVLLCVAAGRPDRVAIRAETFLFTAEARVGPPAPPPRHDPIFDRRPSTWPEPGQTLRRFALPSVDGVDPSAPDAQWAVQMAADLWNAVVRADYLGDEAPFERVREVARSAPAEVAAVMDRLIRRKREAFGGDPRILSDVRVEAGPDGPRVLARARLPEGYWAGGRRRPRG